MLSAGTRTTQMDVFSCKSNEPLQRTRKEKCSDSYLPSGELFAAGGAESSALIGRCHCLSRVTGQSSPMSSEYGHTMTSSHGNAVWAPSAFIECANRLSGRAAQQYRTLSGVVAHVETSRVSSRPPAPHNVPHSFGARQVARRVLAFTFSSMCRIQRPVRLI